MISPEDCKNLVKQLANKAPNKVQLVQYPSGAISLEFGSAKNIVDDWEGIADTLPDTRFAFLTPEALNSKTGLPMLVARERLLQAERQGLHETS